MRLYEILNESNYENRYAGDRETQLYMEGQCVKLAVALNTLNPDRFILGCLYEHTAAPNHDTNRSRPLENIF